MIRLGKILLVDDDEGITKMIERSLVRLGYTVKSAASVEGAVEILSKDPQDLVITDMYMPTASGIDLLETIRAAELDTDVIMLSGQNKIATAVEAMRLGAVNYLEKPVDMERMKQAVREVFKARQARKDTPVPVVLDSSVSTHVKERIGRFQLEERIGAGSMGTVYRATDTVLERKVALKVFALKASDREYVERFRREAKAAAKLNHPNIAAVHDYGEEDGVLFIAMELVPGASLETRLRSDEKLPPVRVVHIAFQLVDALEHAHSIGVVHRDVKPGNILLGDGDRVKLVDFGVARLAGSELTGAGLMLGSPAYMSPEGTTGTPVDYRADQFSTGTVLYEALTGDKPFKAGSVLATVKNVLNKEPEPISKLGIDAPELEAIILRLHKKKPEERYENEHELLIALTEAGKRYGMTLVPALHGAL